MRSSSASIPQQLVVPFSSVLDFNPWSSDPIPKGSVEYPIARIVEQGLKLAADLRARGVDVEPHAAALGKIARRIRMDSGAVRTIPSRKKNCEIFAKSWPHC